MKISTTSERLKFIMKENNFRQVDILNACKPFCEKEGIKLGRNDLSQYINGKVEPSQSKLTILSKALNVSEPWLMGYEDSGKVNQQQNIEPLFIPEEYRNAVVAFSNGIKDLTQDDIDSVIDFIEFRKNKKK